jgi:hypothetical protein
VELPLVVKRLFRVINQPKGTQLDEAAIPFLSTGLTLQDTDLAVVGQRQLVRLWLDG